MTFWSRDQVTNIKLYICTSTITMVTKLGWVATWVRGPQLQKHLLITWSRDKWKKPYICICTKSMATKVSIVLTYGQKILPNKSREFLIMWSYDKWKKIISPLPQYLWYQTWHGGNLVWEDPSTNLWDLLITWSRHKWKKL